MLKEDNTYMTDILAAFKVSSYKLSETDTRFKLIIKPDDPFDMETLHGIQGLRDPVGIEIDVNSGIYLECLKQGCSRKRRRVQLETFDGPVPEKYNIPKFQKAIREILSIPDICEFETSVDDEVLTISNLDTISYPVLKRIENTGCKVKINMLKSNLTISL